MWAAAGALEAPLWWPLLVGTPLLPPAATAAAHVLAAALLFFASPQAGGWLSERRHWGRPAFFLTLLLPGLGWALVGLMRLSHDPDNEPEEFSLPKVDEEEKEAAFAGIKGERAFGGEKQRLLEAIEIAPAADILLGTDPTLKRGAIETLARLRNPESIYWLLKARQDPNPDVRFFATAALTSLRRDFEQRVRAAQRLVYEKPLEREPQLTFHATALEYALSGLVDDVTKEEMLEHSRERISSMGKDPDTLGLRFKIDMALNPAHALELTKTLIEENKLTRPYWLKQRIRLLFRLGRHQEIPRTAQALGKALNEPSAAGAQPGDDAAWKSVIIWWTGG